MGEPAEPLDRVWWRALHALARASGRRGCAGRGFCALAACLALSAAATAQTPGQIATVAGTGQIAGPAKSPAVGAPVGVAVDGAGNLYFSSTRNQIFKVDAQGNLTTVAGSSSTGYSGDGGPATAASFNFFLTAIGAGNLAADSAGNLYLADSDNQVVRRVDAATGVITTVAGNGVQGPAGDGGPATSASLNYPNSVALDGQGNLFIGQAGSFTEDVERVDARTGIISVVAGTQGSTGYSGDGGPATRAQLDGGYSLEVAVDRAGNLYIGDSMNCAIRAVNLQTSPITVATIPIQPGNIATVAGNGSCISNGSNGDGGPATSAVLAAERLGVAVDAAGNIFISGGGVIRRVDGTSGIITTAAGAAQGLAGPVAVTVDGHDNVFIADLGAIPGSNNSQVLRIDGTSGAVTAFAGGTGIGDGGPATSAELWLQHSLTVYSAGVALDGSGNLFIADSENNRVRRVDAASGTITTIAGNGLQGTSGDGGPATAAEMSYPAGVAVDAGGNVFIADFGNGSIRRVDAVTGTMTRVAGSAQLGMNGASCTSGDGGPASSAEAVSAWNVNIDAAGNLYIAGGTSNCVGRIDAVTGILTTVAGNGGKPGFTGDGGPATSACMNWPSAVAADSAGNIYIADLFNGRIRQVDHETGFISTVAGGGGAPPGGPALGALLVRPSGVAVSATGNLFIADYSIARVYRVDHLSGILTVVAGNGTSTFSGDGANAAAAGLDFPSKIALQGNDLYIADAWNQRVRHVALPAYVVLGATSEAFGSQALNTPSAPQMVTLTNSGDTPLAVMSVAASGDFSETDNCASGLAVGASCTISIVFTPTEPGARTGAITITDNAADNPETISLSGTGAGAGLAFSTGLLTFPSQMLGTTSAAGTVMVMNSGTQPVSFTAIAATGEFAVTQGANMCSTSTTLAVGASCTIYVTFTPQAAGNRTGSLMLTDNATGSPQTVMLSGTGTAPNLEYSNGVIFGSQLVNTTTAPIAVTLRNPATAFSVSLASMVISGDFAVAANGTTCSTSVPLAPGASCAINLTFTPTAVGIETGTLTLTDDAGNSPQIMNLSGTGTQPAFSASTGTLTFAAQLAGTTSSSQPVMINNMGTGNLNFSSIAVSRPFAIVAAGGGCSTTAAVAAGSSCAVMVTFTPAAAGAATGSLSFTDNAPGSPHSIALNGTGQDFSFTPSPGSSTTASVAPGQPATYTLNVGSEGGLTGTVSFTFAGVPSEANCAASPNPAPLGMSVTVGCTTTAPSGMWTRIRRLPPLSLWSSGGSAVYLFTLALAALAWAARRRTGLRYGMRQAGLLSLAAGVVLALMLGGCGGGSSVTGIKPSDPGTPAGSYTITVTGTVNSAAGASSHTVTLTLNVS